jgi:flagellar hook assembly protein FlgD
MDASRTVAQNAKLSTLEHNTVSKDGMASSAAAGEAIKQFKRVK